MAFWRALVTRNFRIRYPPLPPIFLGSKTSYSFFTALLFYEEWNRAIGEVGFHFQLERRKYTSRIQEDSSDSSRLHNVCGYTCLYVSTSKHARKNTEWDSYNSYRTKSIGSAIAQRVSRPFSKLTSSLIYLLHCCRIAWWWPNCLPKHVAYMRNKLILCFSFRAS